METRAGRGFLMSQQQGVRIVYFGTPEFAVPALRSLALDHRYDVRLVVTQPDRPAGRGHRLTPPPVKLAAETLGIPVYQPATLKSKEDRDPLLAAEWADLFVVAAFGLIFGPKTLAIPRTGCTPRVNFAEISRSGLIAAAIASGDEVTGISLMNMDVGLDTGPVIAVGTLEIAPEDTTESLTARLSDFGAELAVAHLAEYASGLELVVQDDRGASVVRPLKKADGWLDWTKPAEELERWVRAMRGPGLALGRRSMANLSRFTRHRLFIPLQHISLAQFS